MISRDAISGRLGWLPCSTLDSPPRHQCLVDGLLNVRADTRGSKVLKNHPNSSDCGRNRRNLHDFWNSGDDSVVSLAGLAGPELSCMSVQFTLRTMSRELHGLLLCSFGKCPTGGVLLASRHVRCAILCEYFVSTKQWKPAQRAISFARHPALCCFRQEA